MEKHSRLAQRRHQVQSEVQSLHTHTHSYLLHTYSVCHELRLVNIMPHHKQLPLPFVFSNARRDTAASNCGLHWLAWGGRLICPYKIKKERKCNMDPVFGIIKSAKNWFLPSFAYSCFMYKHQNLNCLTVNEYWKCPCSSFSEMFK